MNYLAVRNGEGKGVYWYETNGEKSRILSKVSGSSTRGFTGDMKTEACAWAGVDDVVSEELNKWATSKNIAFPQTASNEIEQIEQSQPIVPIKENIVQNDENINDVVELNVPMPQIEINIPTNIVEQQPLEITSIEDIISKENNEIVQEKKKKEKIEKIEKDISFAETPTAQKDEIKIEQKSFVGKHTPTNFEYIVDTYKKTGNCVLLITMNSGDEYCFIPDNYWYLAKDYRKFKYDENPIFDVNAFTCSYMKNLITKECKLFRETKTGPKNPVFGEIVTTQMLSYIPKTKYYAYGDLVFFNNANFFNYEENIDEDGNYGIKAIFEKNKKKENVTINVNNIANITIIDDIHTIETREFINLLKRTQKELEQEKLQNSKQK